MKLIMSTRKRTLDEKRERGDRQLDDDEIRGEIVDILVTGLVANGMRLCGDSDADWESYEKAVIRQFKAQIAGNRKKQEGQA